MNHTCYDELERANHVVSCALSPYILALMKLLTACSPSHCETALC